MPRNPRPDEIVAAIGRTPYGELLRDPNYRHELLFHALASNDDPVSREIGEQLRAGTARPHQLLQNPAYRQFFADALTAANSLDLEKIRADAEAAANNDTLTGDTDQDQPFRRGHDDRRAPDDRR